MQRKTMARLEKAFTFDVQFIKQSLFIFVLTAKSLRIILGDFASLREIFSFYFALPSRLAHRHARTRPRFRQWT
jgi:hypothetical protein